MDGAAIAGCAAPENTQVAVIDPSGRGRFMYSCFEHQTVADLLHGALTWRYYAPGPGTIWTAPNAIKHICQPTVAHRRTWPASST